MARRKQGDFGCGGILLLLIGFSVFNACGGGSSPSSSSSSRPRPIATQRVAANQASTRTTATPRPSRTPRPSPTLEAAVYIVQSGDTLGAIAAQYDVSVEALAEANGIIDPNRIAVGDELSIPGGTGGASASVTEAEPARLASDSASLLVMPESADPATVDRVIDGDTVDVWLEDGRLIRLRLIGLDTPETVDPNTPEECFGRQASDRAKLLLGEGQAVFLEADDSQGDTDRYDRYLRYLWLEDGGMFNYAMIAEGYAIEYTYDLPYRYQAQFREAQRNAAENGLGLWDINTCGGNADLPADGEGVPVPEVLPPTDTPVPPATPIPVPTDVPVPPPTAVPPPSNCDPSYPTVCIPPPPPDLDCGDISFRRFQVVGRDPHRFDGDNDGIGCES